MANLESDNIKVIADNLTRLVDKIYSKNVTFYSTIDDTLVINISDISFIEFVPVYKQNNEKTINYFDFAMSFYNVHMKGNQTAIRLSYRDGVQLLNIMQTRQYGLYKDNAITYSYSAIDNNLNIVTSNEYKDNDVSLGYEVSFVSSTENEFSIPKEFDNTIKTLNELDFPNTYTTAEIVSNHMINWSKYDLTSFAKMVKPNGELPVSDKKSKYINIFD